MRLFIFLLTTKIQRMDTDADFNNGLPLFCVQVTDKISKKNVFINFKSSSLIEPPDDIPDDDLLNDKRPKFIIPLRLSPLYYTKDGRDDYVIIILINDVFSIRRVLVSDIMRVYLTQFALTEIEKRYNSPESAKITGQFIGHKLELERKNSKTLTKEQCKERITKFVNNKITLLQADAQPPDQSDNTAYDLHYRPASKILTCSVHTEKLPDSVAFNEDRILIKQDDNILVDVDLPIFINLKEPLKYKFDDRIGLFRAVFKTIEKNEDRTSL